ncbi:hypothetical protein EPA93_28295 [Ktedonosporobacter rubrisoli]|uniref:Uncharacterized protein n=1 Tax=Ktedonosporobacter rubrisoli TaxID=2509675 RepID=A0A4P6JVG8_KTERU|nr:hypothetical protein [Ktedonosporobacter rubrisoli]QBD79668.1 hypothetical protein EPA93_28295 [Ktedonosporobacter rubrisoli]
MNRRTKLLGAMLFALVLLTSLGIASASAHTFPALQPSAASAPSLAPDEASVELADGSVTHLSWGRPTYINHVVKICTGSQTKARFRLSTGTRFIDPDTCQSFADQSGFVQALQASPQA